MATIFERLLGRNQQDIVDQSTYTFSISGGQTRTGEAIDAEKALKNATVFTCVSIVASTVAQLPWGVERKTADGTQTVEHPALQLLHRPNAIQSEYEFKHNLIVDLLTHGNAYVLKVVTKSGKTIELIPLDADKVEITRSASGKRTYTFDNSNVYGEDQLIHIRDFANHTTDGLSKVLQCANLVAVDNAIDYSMADIFKNGNAVAGVIEYPTNVPPEAAAAITEGYSKKFGANGSARGGVMVLGDGGEFTQLNPLTAADSDMLKLKEQTIARICAVFNVPSYMLEQSNGTQYNNLSQRQTSFYRDSIAPLLTNIEQKLSAALLGADYKLCVAFDHQDLVKGDLETSINIAVSGVRNGVLTQNEGRTLIGYNPHDQEGADDLLDINFTDNPANEEERELDDESE
jgi:HK97 family phage portal protein